MALTQVVSVQCEDPSKGVSFAFLQVVDGNLVLAEQIGTNTLASPGGTTGDEWARYELFLDVVLAKLTLVREGARVGERTLELDHGAPSALRIGVTYTAPGEKVDLRYDDVGFETR